MEPSGQQLIHVIKRNLSDSSLFFIAYIPPEPTFQRLIKLKEEVAVQFESKAALRSPPHLTLHMPFRWPIKRMSLLVNTLTKFFTSYRSYTIELNGFGTFAPKVIYVKVDAEPGLVSIQKNLCKVMATQLGIYNAIYGNKPFHPHITIAFRDLKKSKFYQAWEYYHGQTFQAECRVNRITLLKHNGKVWEQELHFNLGTD